MTRPVWATLHALVASGKIRAVFISQIDRLSRNPLEVLRFIRHCRKHGVLIALASGLKKPLNFRRDSDGQV